MEELPLDESKSALIEKKEQRAFLQLLAGYSSFLECENKAKGKVLIIEDDEDLAKDLKQLLEKSGYSCATTAEGNFGEKLALLANPDVIILDRMLPDGDGLSICHELRERGSNAKILMLTAISDVDSVVDGLNTGADDYLSKPFDFLELLARVRGLMERPNRFGTNVLRYAHVAIDIVNNSVSVAGLPVEFYSIDRAVLEYLIRRPETFISNDEIINGVWKAAEAVSSDSVRASILRLRKITNTAQYPQVIHNRYGSGYMLSIWEPEKSVRLD